MNNIFRIWVYLSFQKCMNVKNGIISILLAEKSEVPAQAEKADQ